MTERRHPLASREDDDSPRRATSIASPHENRLDPGTYTENVTGGTAAIRNKSGYARGTLPLSDAGTSQKGAGRQSIVRAGPESGNFPVERSSASSANTVAPVRTAIAIASLGRESIDTVRPSIWMSILA